MKKINLHENLHRLKTTRSSGLFRMTFISFICITILLTVIFWAFFYYNLNAWVSNSTSDVLSTRLEEISEDVDNKVLDLNSVSTNITLLQSVRELMSKIASLDGASTHDEAFRDEIIGSNGFKDLRSYCGTQKNVDQILLVFPNDHILASGLYNDLYINTEECQDYRDLLGQFSTPTMIYYSSLNPYTSPYYTSDLGKSSISLLKEYKTVTQEPIIIVVNGSLLKLTDSVYGYQPLYNESVSLYDSFGTQILPFTEKRCRSPYFEFLKDRPDSNEILSFQPAKANTKEQLLYNYSSFSGLTCVVSLDHSVITNLLKSSIISSLPFILIVFTLALPLSLWLSRFISKPVSEIYHYVKTTDFSETDHVVPLSISNNQLDEINILADAFNLLQQKLQDANQKRSELQQRELHARMLSLQSQMNPHFLYNSLSNIQAMSEEGLHEEVEEMCQVISRILRYISSNSEPLVPICEEILHTKDYLRVMQLRYMDDLAFEIDIPQEMNEIIIPKLSIQLLVENAVKFVTKVLPPWTIYIKGQITIADGQKKWQITVSDNGPGFSSEKLSELQNQFKKIERTNTSPALEVNGMGLLNIFIRLRLISPEYTFVIRNQRQAGAQVTIGGNIKE